MYIHLRAHSYFSFLEGLPSPRQWVQAAANAGMPAIGLTDHHTLTGAVEFYQACQEQSIQAILGLSLEVNLPARFQSVTSAGAAEATDFMVLLACDLSGWRSLCRISSALMEATPHATIRSISFECLAQDSTGLICLAAGAASQPFQWVRQRHERPALEYLQRLQEIFPNRLYIEISRNASEHPSLTKRMAAIARQMRLSLAGTQPAYYLSPEHEGLQRLVTAIRLNCRMQEIPPGACAPTQAYFLAPQAMHDRFSDLPEALDTSIEIASRCQLQLPLGAAHFPLAHLPEGQHPDQVLRQKAYQGARQRYGELKPEVLARLEHELAVIQQKGYTSLFLIMEEIIDFTHRADIPTASRGSASSSLVAHCLGITTPDPVRLNLYFERFLNPARSSPPDIDTDLCSQRRDEVIQHVYQTYGADRVAMVATINRFRARSALRETAKAHGIPATEITKLVESIPARGWGAWRGGQGAGESPYAELAAKQRSPQWQAVFRDALALLKTPHHLSVHAGGVVIAPGELTDLLPLCVANKGMRITQFDLDSVEALGLVKLDLLGIRGLSVLGQVAGSLAKQQQPVTTRLAVLDSIPQADPATTDLVRNGRTIGCFQIESPGMRATLREIQATSIDDIMVALALYRPGPLSGGLKDAFVQRHLGKEAIHHLHPALKTLLEETYGVILYQEQVLRIAHELAGLDLAEADLLRRAMSHFDPGKQMQTLKEKFIAGALAKNRVAPEVGEHIWELMAAFAGYGFPKAHAASYAQFAWRSAWCKTHHPAEFMAAVLANWGGYYSQRVYLMEARRLGIPVRPPHVNYSQPEFSVVYQGQQAMLYMGLDQVRDLTRRTQRSILQRRPFQSLADFLQRADPRPREAENLVSAGALSGMGSPAELLWQLKTSSSQQGQMALFPMDETPPTASEQASATPAEIAALQEAILGISVDVHPLELVSEQIRRQGVINTAEAAAHLGKRVRLAGMRQTWRRLSDPAGAYSMSLEDLEGVMEVILLPEVYRRYRPDITSRNPLLVEGVVEILAESAEPILRAEKIWRING